MARDQNSLPIGIVADNEPLAARLRRLVARRGFPLAFEVSPEAVESDDAVAGAELVVVATNPPDGSLVRRVRIRLPEAGIVACADAVESPTVRWALELGVDGLIWNDQLEKTLELTLRAVHAGQVVIPGDILRNRKPPGLTNREKQALSMVIMGMTNLEIAQKLFISESTVKSHLNTAFRKLGVHSRAEAQQLITDPDEGLGPGILAITSPGLSRGRPPRKAQD